MRDYGRLWLIELITWAMCCQIAFAMPSNQSRQRMPLHHSVYKCLALIYGTVAVALYDYLIIMEIVQMKPPLGRTHVSLITVYDPTKVGAIQWQLT